LFHRGILFFIAGVFGDSLAANPRPIRQTKRKIIEKGVTVVSFAQSLLTGVFCMSVVFSVLMVLWALIRLSSVVLAKIAPAKKP
jgi:hypothetical protein